MSEQIILSGSTGPIVRKESLCQRINEIQIEIAKFEHHYDQSYIHLTFFSYSFAWGTVLWSTAKNDGADGEYTFNTIQELLDFLKHLNSEQS